MSKEYSEEVRRQLNNLAGSPAASVTMDREDYRNVLLRTGGNMLACGRLYNFKAKNMGAGIYQVTLELANP